MDAEFVIASPDGDYQTGDTIPTGQYDRFFEDAAGEWRDLGLSYNGSRVPGIDSIVFHDPDGRRNKEGLWPYGIWNERGNWPATAGETYTIIFDIHWTDAEIQTDTIEVIANPNTPPIPPDTVPIPPDTVPPGSGGLAWYASPWHDYYLQPGDTIQDGGYSIGLVKDDGGPVVADSVYFFIENSFYAKGNLTGGSYHTGFTLDVGPRTLGYRVFGGDNEGVGVLPLVIADHNGGNIPWPDTIPLSTPANFRVEKQAADTSKTLIAWDPIPEAKQCENDLGTPVNCKGTYGDEVYYRVTSYVVWPVDALEPGRSWFATDYAMASTARSFPWDYPGPGEILPDSIQFCVEAQAWDCPSCTGPGGRWDGVVREGNPVSGIPISETGCSGVLEVR